MELIVGGVSVQEKSHFAVRGFEDDCGGRQADGVDYTVGHLSFPDT